MPRPPEYLQDVSDLTERERDLILQPGRPCRAPERADLSSLTPDLRRLLDRERVIASGDAAPDATDPDPAAGIRADDTLSVADMARRRRIEAGLRSIRDAKLTTIRGEDTARLRRMAAGGARGPQEARASTWRSLMRLLNAELIAPEPLYGWRVTEYGHKMLKYMEEMR